MDCVYIKEMKRLHRVILKKNTSCEMKVNVSIEIQKFYVKC